MICFMVPEKNSPGSFCPDPSTRSIPTKNNGSFFFCIPQRRLGAAPAAKRQVLGNLRSRLTLNNKVLALKAEVLP